MKVSQISAELDRIWSTLEQSNKMRVSLFNLVVVARKTDRLPYVRQITRNVLERFPSRVIFVLINPESSADCFEATVSVISDVSHHEAACDCIELETSMNNRLKVPFAILPHLLPDLPVYVLWQDQIEDEDFFFNPLEGVITRMIFDSEVADHFSTFARGVLHKQSQLKCDIADLNWARTACWRELLASTFYSSDQAKLLQEMKQITLTFNNFSTEVCRHTTFQSLYIQGWLATQLGWSMTKAEPLRFEYGSSQIDLIPSNHPHLPQGGVISLEISTTTGAHFTFLRDENHPNEVKTICCDANKCDILSKYIFTKIQTGLSLTEEIYHKGTSAPFHQVLQFFSLVK